MQQSKRKVKLKNDYRYTCYSILRLQCFSRKRRYYIEMEDTTIKNLNNRPESL